MKIDQNLQRFLKNEEFSSGALIRFAWEKEDYRYLSRFVIIPKLVQGKKIIHIGCLDHDPTVVSHKIKRNKWMHKCLCDVTKRCLGIDIQKEGISFLKNTLGYQDVEYWDITLPGNRRIEEEQWDYVVLPEVLEHIGNPVHFLEKIRENVGCVAKKIIITVPNVFSLNTSLLRYKGVESINTDHRFWFTPYTIMKVVTDAGYTIEDVTMCKATPITPYSVIKNLYYKLFPLLRNDILVVARF
jgi:2-polyprenyl-3-methyl-5-hydroxy-6-metoxy-1,4-benzoquinol methylase